MMEIKKGFEPQTRLYLIDEQTALTR